MAQAEQRKRQNRKTGKHGGSPRRREQAPRQAEPSLASVKEIIATIGAHRHPDSSEDAPRAVVWVIGKDRPGILAAVTTLLFKSGVNILDVSQTVLRGMFAMILLGDISKLKVSFAALKLELESLGKELSMVVSTQRAAVFEQMHRL